MNQTRQGICPVCQSKQLVSSSSAPRHDYREIGWDDEEIDRCHGEEVNFVLISHDFYGQPCEGGGQMPEAVLPPTVV